MVEGEEEEEKEDGEEQEDGGDGELLVVSQSLKKIHEEESE